jgi:hypothetical protein
MLTEEHKAHPWVFEDAGLRLEDSAALGFKAVELYDQAIAAGEKFVAGSQNPNRLVHARLAELYLSQGNATQSLAHLALSNGHLQSGSSHSVTVQSRTQESVQAPQEAESPAASATIGPNGVEASAGNARASVKP